jgi:hypothetical protein
MSALARKRLGVRVGGVRRRAELAERRRCRIHSARVQARPGNHPAHARVTRPLAGRAVRVGVAAVRQAAERQRPRVRRQVAPRLHLAGARGVPAF